MAKDSVQFDIRDIPRSVRVLVESIKTKNNLNGEAAGMIAMMIITDHGPTLTNEEIGIAWRTVRKDYLGPLPGSYSTKPLQ